MTNFFIVSLPIVIAINLLLGVMVLLTHVHRLVNRMFAVLSAVIALWLACQYFGSVAHDLVWLTFWVRQACAASVFVPLFFHLLRKSVTQSSSSILRLIGQSWMQAAAAVATAILCQTPFFLVGARFPEGVETIAEPIYRGGFVFFVGYWVVTVATLIWSFFRALVRSEGIARMELQIMSLGSLFGFVPGVLLILLVPLATGSSQSGRFTPITVVTWLSVIAYGIVTRHIMGVGEFLRRGLTFALLVGLMSLLYLVVFRLVFALPLNDIALRRTVAHVSAAVAMALALAPANAFLRRGTDRLFDDEYDDLTRLMHNGGELARSITTIDALFDRFGRLLQDSLGLTQVCMYLLDAGTEYVLRANLGTKAVAQRVAKNDALVRALHFERCPLFRDVLRRSGDSRLQRQAEQALSRLKTDAAVALRTNNGLMGFLLLGGRKKGKVFGRREENALMFLGDQMGIAIENATLYTRLRDAQIYDEVLLDNLVTGVVAADMEGYVKVCNREAVRILQLTEVAPVVGRSASEIFPAAIWNEMRESLASGKGVCDRDFSFETATHEERHVRIATAVFGGDGRVKSGVLVVVQDTTALRKLEEQIRRSDRLASIGTLAAGMAHEIKNPLVCLKTFVQLLPSRYDDPDFRNTFTPLLGNEVERINAIVSQLLDFSRPVKSTLVPLALHTVLDEAGQLAAQQLKAKGLVFQRHYDATNDRLLGDHHLLGQVFLNLFLNGIDAMDRGGTLTVTTTDVLSGELPWRTLQKDAATWIEVRVNDTGRGIPLENRPQIFDPFFTTKANGTGLGLAVAHGIILEHRGVIDVESTIGVGTSFRILFPLLGADGHAADCGKDAEA